MPIAPTISSWILAAVLCNGQAFEVATVKLAGPRTRESTGATSVEVKPGAVTMRSVGLGSVITWAYRISPHQISNGAARRDEMRVMMQALLAERFKLASHRETRLTSAYALVQAKGGHKLKESAAGEDPGVTAKQEGRQIALNGRGGTLEQLAYFLSVPLGIVVVDKTGLKGYYDFNLDLSSFVRSGPGSGEPPVDPVAVFQAALPRQLGLRLEARKLPVEMLVIDHIGKGPVEN